MQTYLTHYTLPVLLILALVIATAKVHGRGKRFKVAVFVATGFLLGWASAYLSLYLFHLYK
jgi:predicted metal-binding membrane protein